MLPTGGEVIRCRLCRREIFFAVTKRGRRQPLDVKPDPARGTVLAYRSKTGAWRARSAISAEECEQPLHPLEQRFRPHAETCPKRERPVQPAIPGLLGIPSPSIYNVKASAGPLPDNVIPFRFRRARRA